MFELLFDFILDTLMHYEGTRFDHLSDLFEAVALILTFFTIGAFLIGIIGFAIFLFKWAAALGGRYL